LKKLPGIGADKRLVEIDVWNDRSTDEERLPVRVVSFKLDSHRQPLDDLDVVARGILRRQQRECRSRPHSKAGDPAIEHLPVAVHVDIQLDRLADAQVAQLRLLEIGVDPDLGERADRHQALPDLNIIARIDVSARDHAVDFGGDVAISKVELGERKIAVGGFELGLGLLDGRRVRGKPSERGVDVALLFELFNQLLRRQPIRMDDAELGRTLNEVGLCLQHRGEGLVEIGRDFGEICTLLGLRRQSQRDPDLVHIGK
jgi:hypothetical protein